MNMNMKVASGLMSLLMISICGTGAATGELSSLEAVVDLEGDEVKTGEEYYILAIDSGFSLGSTGCNPCPHDVVLEPSDVYLGIPLTFLPINPADSVVRVSTDVRIKFSATDAAESTVWSLEQDRCTNRSIVTTGGRGVNAWFRFEQEVLFIYRIESCSCPNSFAPCGVLAFPVLEEDSPQKRLFISSTAPSTIDRAVYVGIAKSNYTRHPNMLMMNIINGIHTSH